MATGRPLADVLAEAERVTSAAIEAGVYVARLTADDWGLYRTLQLNTQRLRTMVTEVPVDPTLVVQRLDDLWRSIDAKPKSLRWRLRARVGDRMSWYELPEEVRQPYQAEG